MMKVRAQFLGKDGEMGFHRYRYYDLNLDGHTVVRPVPDTDITEQVICTYETVEDFLRHWHVARTS